MSKYFKKIVNTENISEWQSKGLPDEVIKPPDNTLTPTLKHTDKRIKRELRSLLVYNFKCNSCNADYIGKTERHYRKRTSKHIGVSPLTGKCIKNNSQTSAIHDHMLFCKTVVCPEVFSILANSSYIFKL